MLSANHDLARAERGRSAFFLSPMAVAPRVEIGFSRESGPTMHLRTTANGSYSYSDGKRSLKSFRIKSAADSRDRCAKLITKSYKCGSPTSR